MLFRKILVLLFTALFLVKSASALNISLPNNKFGIHLAVPDTDDIKSAAQLVNASGGRWGYITLVMQDNDRNHGKWQEIFDRMRELELIPIIRIGTAPTAASWRRPDAADIDAWVDFLDSLNWVVKDRYVVLYNEPNHGSEWGGSVDPKSYSEIASKMAKGLKAKNSDFFVMLAGFDAAAPSAPPTYEDMSIFLTKALTASPSLFDNIDGWVSHSYPNPGFSGSPNDFGRGTIRSYDWELWMLKNLGITKDLPVFITETGWKYDNEKVTEYYKRAFEIWGLDNKIRAVTPFILNYQGEPFLGFSWQKKDSKEFYPHYYAIQEIVKTKGEPEQKESGALDINLPSELTVNSTYRFSLILKNEGQSIWEADNEYAVKLENADLFQEYFFADINDIKPFKSGRVDIFVKTGPLPQRSDIKVGFYKGEKEILSKTWTVSLTKQPDLAFKVGFFPRLREKKDSEFEIQIFDKDEQLVFKRAGIKKENSIGEISSVQNVYIGGRYRIVVLSDHYLPRQAHVVFKKGGNTVRFKPMLPLDYNVDGKFDLWDILTIVKNPRLFGLFIP